MLQFLPRACHLIEQAGLARRASARCLECPRRHGVAVEALVDAAGTKSAVLQEGEEFLGFGIVPKPLPVFELGGEREVR